LRGVITRLPVPRARPTVAEVPARGTRSHLWERFRRNRLAVIGSAIVLAEIVLAVVGPFIAPYDPIDQQTAIRLQPPSSAHWLGTDDLGRDVLSRIMHGASLSLGAGVAVVLFGIVTGIPLGAIAAYFRRTDALIMRFCEIMLAVPGILLALVLVATMGPGFISVLLGAGLAGMPSVILLTRSLVLALRENDFVIAAKAVGCQEGRILVRHILPNTTSSLVVSQTFRIAAGILTVSSLSFLGLGAQPPAPEWGAMLSNGRDFLYRAPHVAAFPGLALTITVFAFNLVGDGLRDVLDPRFVSRGEGGRGH
jgi:peptide/nickel transport system permease protein